MTKARYKVSPFDFTDPILFLAALLDGCVKNNPNLSRRSILEHAGFQSTDLIFKILRGERRLQVAFSSEVGLRLGLQDEELEYFELLTALKMSETLQQKKIIESALFALREGRPRHTTALTSSGPKVRYIIGIERTYSNEGELLFFGPQHRKLHLATNGENLIEEIFSYRELTFLQAVNRIDQKAQGKFSISSDRFTLPGRIIPEGDGWNWSAYSFFVSYKGPDGGVSANLRGRDEYFPNKFSSFESFDGVSIGSFARVVEGRYVGQSEFEDSVAKDQRSLEINVKKR